MNKKYLKFSLIGALLSSAIIIASVTPPIFLNQNTSQTTVQGTNDTDYTNELDYIRNDAEKQGDVETKIASIRLVGSSASCNSHSAAIVTKTNGSTLLYMWGQNRYGQLGFTENSNPNPTPKLVQSPYFSNSPIKQVALGEYHSAALLDDGSLYMWGYNSTGQLGIGVSGSGAQVSTPTPVTGLASQKITKISLGGRHSAALLADGSLYTWGYNSNGQLGNGSIGSSTSTSTPAKMSTTFPSTIKQLELGESYTAVLLNDGSLYTWGQGGHGQLAMNSTGDLPSPSLVNSVYFNSKKITQIAVSLYITAALTEDNKIYIWGLNEKGILGNIVANNKIPTLFDTTGFGSNKIIQIALGDRFAGALLDDGSLYMWGDNYFGQLGFTANNIANPTPIKVDPEYFDNKKIKEIVLNTSNSIVILDDDTLYTWGSNSNGQLGNTTNSGNSNANPTPTWLSKLGKPSQIMAKTKLTAKEAVDNLWVDNKFNLIGFKNSFELINIPDVTDQIFSMVAKPTYDNQNGTLTMKVGMKYFYDENGFIVANTAATAMFITGFMPSTTKISVKTNPKTDIVIDKWLDSVMELTYIDRQKLEEYLLLENVPEDAVFTITDINQNLSTGVLEFNITSSKTIKQDNTIIGESEPFPITLNLIARVTKVSARTNYNKIVIDKLKDLIFDEAGVAKLSEINKYVEITAPVDGATLNLKPNSYVIDTGMGTAKFTIFFDKYYDANGAEKTQTATSIKQSFDISLDLLPMASVITSKSTYTPTHRVDRFTTAFTDADGKVTNETILKQYIDIENMPTGYSLSIKDYNIIDPIDGTVSFTVVASNYNDLNFESQTNGEFPIQLLKLLPKYPTTDISAKTEADYDDTVRLDRFVSLFADEATGVVNNIDKLGEFLDLVSIPENATLTVKNIKMTNAIGKITFDIEVSKYYDADSDLQNATKSFSIELNLGIKYIPTEITANKNIVYPERVDRFETKITELSGTPELQTYLQSKYITIVGDLPKGTTFSVDNIVGVNETGIINFDLTASAFYDENSDRIENKVISLELSLRIKYAPTVLTAKAKEDYTAQDRVDRFEHTLKMFKDQDLKTYLSNYVEGINTLVAGSTLVASAVTSEITTGAISFKLTTNKYYDADSDLQVTTQEWTIALELGIKHEQTKVTSKTGDFTHIVVDQFIPLFTDEQLVVDDKTELNKYVDITALPADANLIVKDANMTFSTGMIIFKIVADKFYDGESDLITTFSQEYIIKLTLGIKYQATTVSAIKGYDQSENVETFANQIKTLTGDALKTYLDTYLQIKGDLPADAILSVDVNSITTDLETGKVSFSVQLDKYYDATGSLQSNGSFTIKLKLAF